MSHPARGAWIEISMTRFVSGVTKSHPARGAWIEIQDKLRQMMTALVAPRKGCVD